MTKKIKIGIIGYGNIGKGIELAIEQNQDMQLAAIFTRRKPETIKSINRKVKILPVSQTYKFKKDIDVAILCGGSATDLPKQGPKFASIFNTVDSYDTHARISQYFNAVDKAARKAGKTSVISTGWDPGLFSILRVIEESVLPCGKGYTFWGPGVSQGHSNAIRKIKGVKDAQQYTIPIKDALEKVRDGENPKLITRQMHLRDCYVVTEDGADLQRIKQEIKTMPNYFADYNTKVTFISEKEMKNKHSQMPHGGFVIRTGLTGKSQKHLMEFKLKLDSNPEFTANVLVAYARAAFLLNKEGNIGAKTVFDVPIGYLSIKSLDELIKSKL
jgi:diaminopimelate dehydrogenase